MLAGRFLACCMTEKVGRLLCTDITDAEEVLRIWRLRCIQAEAELRALQARQPLTKATSGDPVGISGAGDTVTPPPHDTRSPEPEREPQEDCVPEVDAHEALASVLALEKQIDELRTWSVHIEQETSLAYTLTEASEMRLEEERRRAKGVASRAGVVFRRVGQIMRHHADIKTERDCVCNELEVAACTMKSQIGLGGSILRDVQRADKEFTDLRNVVSQLESKVDEASQQRERLWMHREETRKRMQDSGNLYEQRMRENSLATHTVQRRTIVLQRMQGDEIRNRTTNVRKRRQTELQLSQYRNELAVAITQADAAAEQLRKVKQQHGRQLKALRAESGDLQAEVDAHIQFIEASEVELNALHAEKCELEGGDRHAKQELMLEVQAVTLRRDLVLAEQNILVESTECRSLQEKLRMFETEQSVRQNEECTLAKVTLDMRQRTEEAAAASAEAREELDQQHSALQGHSADAARLQALTDQVESVRESKSQRSEEYGHLLESGKQLQQAHDRHIADMQELARRILRIKLSHKELLDVLPSLTTKGREALLGSIEQPLGRAGKKVDALLSYLETLGQGSKRQSAPDGQSSQRSQAALQRRLHAETERHMEAALTAQRRKVVIEQERSLEETRRRTDELQRARHERRQLEAELAQRRQVYAAARANAESEVQCIRAQLQLLDGESLQGASVVSSEFSDLLQKHTIDRDLLQQQVNELRNEIDGSRGTGDEQDDSAAKAEEELPPLDVLLRQLSEREEEAELLRKQHEGIQQALVKLKALVVASEASHYGGSLCNQRPKVVHSLASWQVLDRSGGRSNLSPRRGTKSSWNAFGVREAGTPASQHADAHHVGVSSPSLEVGERVPVEAAQTPQSAVVQFSSPLWQHRSLGSQPMSISGSSANLAVNVAGGTMMSGSDDSAPSTSGSTPL